MSDPIIDIPPEIFGETDGQIIEPLGYDFGLTRRTFVAALGAGLLIAAAARLPFAWMPASTSARTARSPS